MENALTGGASRPRDKLSRCSNRLIELVSRDQAGSRRGPLT